MADNSTTGDSAETTDFVCFSGPKRIAQGTLAQVATAAWKHGQRDQAQSTLTFDRESGAVVDLNLSGSLSDVTARYPAAPETLAKRGRPKLGVVAREVTLLPRHWDWLAQQPGGASITLRRLVEAARKDSAGKTSTRDRLAAAYKFMSAMAGDLPQFEEALRALFAQNFPALESCIAGWPADIKSEIKLLLENLQPKAAEET